MTTLKLCTICERAISQLRLNKHPTARDCTGCAQFTYGGMNPDSERRKLPVAERRCLYKARLAACRENPADAAHADIELLEARMPTLDATAQIQALRTISNLSGQHGVR